MARKPDAARLVAAVGRVMNNPVREVWLADGAYTQIPTVLFDGVCAAYFGYPDPAPLVLRPEDV